MKRAIIYIVGLLATTNPSAQTLSQITVQQQHASSTTVAQPWKIKLGSAFMMRENDRLVQLSPVDLTYVLKPFLEFHLLMPAIVTLDNPGNNATTLGSPTVGTTIRFWPEQQLTPAFKLLAHAYLPSPSLPDSETVFAPGYFLEKTLASTFLRFYGNVKFTAAEVISLEQGLLVDQTIFKNLHLLPNIFMKTDASLQGQKLYSDLSLKYFATKNLIPFVVVGRDIINENDNDTLLVAGGGLEVRM